MFDQVFTKTAADIDKHLGIFSFPTSPTKIPILIIRRASRRIDIVARRHIQLPYHFITMDVIVALSATDIEVITLCRCRERVEHIGLTQHAPHITVGCRRAEDGLIVGSLHAATLVVKPHLVRDKRPALVHRGIALARECSVDIDGLDNLKAVVAARLRVLLVSAGSHPHLGFLAIDDLGARCRLDRLADGGEGSVPRQSAVVITAAVSRCTYIIDTSRLGQCSLVSPDIRHAAEVAPVHGDVVVKFCRHRATVDDLRSHDSRAGQRCPVGIAAIVGVVSHHCPGHVGGVGEVGRPGLAHCVECHRVARGVACGE